MMQPVPAVLVSDLLSGTDGPHAAYADAALKWGIVRAFNAVQAGWLEGLDDIDLVPCFDKLWRERMVTFKIN